MSTRSTESHHPVVGGPKLLTVADVMDELGVSRATVYRLMQNGKLRYIRIESMRRFRRQDVDAYVQSNQV